MDKKFLLTIAGFDPTGGAGVSLDSRVFISNGFYPLSVITAIVPQSYKGVEAIYPVNAGSIRESIEILIEDFNILGVKIGVLPDKRIAEIVFSYVKELKIPVVVDTVLLLKGEKILNREVSYFFKRRKFPHILLFTPNRFEAETISGIKIRTKEDIKTAGEKLINNFKTNVLLKGGHIDGKDFLFLKNGEVLEIEGKLKDKDVHGTGCFLSSVILTEIVKGKELEKAVLFSKKKINEEIERAFIMEAHKYYFKF